MTTILEMKTVFSRGVLVSFVFVCAAVGTASSSDAWNSPDVDVITFGGASYDEVRDIAVDSLQNFYVSGSFEGTVDFAPGAATTEKTSNGAMDGFLAKYTDSGTLLWVRTFGGANNDLFGSMVVDAAGNIYATGSFQGTVDIDPGPSTVSVTSNGYSDDFLMKLSTTGEHAWHRTLSSSAPEGFSKIALDSGGNVAALGMIQTTTAIENGSGGTATLTPFGSTNSWDGVVARFSPNGILQWSGVIGGAQDDWFSTLAVDSADAVIVGGNFTGSMDADPTSGTTMVTGTGNYDGVAVKLSSVGGLVWAKAFNSQTESYVTAVTVGLSDAVYVAGTFYDTTDVDPGSNVVNKSVVNTGTPDSFLVQLQSNGNYVWSRVFGTGPDWDYVNAITATEDGVAAVGTYIGAQDLDPGPGVVNADAPGWRDGYVLYLNNDGSTRWVSTFGGPDNDDPYQVVPTSDGGFLVSGTFAGVADFFAGSGSVTMSSNGQSDAFVLKLSSTGTTGVTTTTTTTTVAPTTTTTVATTSPSTTVSPPTTVVATRLQPTLTRSKSPTLSSIALYAGLAVPKGAKVSAVVRSSSAKVCAVRGTRLKGLAKGSCTVTVSVTSLVKGKKKTARSVVRLKVS